LDPGDHISAPLEAYHGTIKMLRTIGARWGLTNTQVDTTDTSAVARAMTDRTKLIWLETPSNPRLQISDIAAIAAIAGKGNARGNGGGSGGKDRSQRVSLVCDNTLATPLLQSPLSLGADVVMHSTTKYLSGHGDVLGGALVTNSAELHERLRFFQNTVGAVPGPQDCFLLLRGIKTLSLRMDRHCASAANIAAFLNDHSAVARTIYPGLQHHPQHLLAQRQLSQFGGIVSFELAGGLGAVKQFVEKCSLWTLAESLGGPKSLTCHPASMTHAAVEPQVRHENGISDGLVRLSIGLENVEDLISDLDRALRAEEKRETSPAREEVAT
ncbi:MAG: PLP-dependent transferase, partial [Planctomycetes bacterium]|nr:PLP-dependent transferase [Planctomycetota bacterium]